MRYFSFVLLFFLSFSTYVIGQEIMNDKLREAIEQLDEIYKQKTVKNAVGQITSYYESNINGYWIIFVYEGINYIGDGGSIMLHKDRKNNWKYYLLGHDEPSSEIPKEIINNYEPLPFKKYHFYIGNKTAYINKNSNTKLLREEEILGYNYWALVLMKNEIYARYGAIFSDTLIINFFSTRTWYKPTKNINKIKLNNIEQKNVKTIDDCIKNKISEKEDKNIVYIAPF